MIKFFFFLNSKIKVITLLCTEKKFFFVLKTKFFFLTKLRSVFLIHQQQTQVWHKDCRALNYSWKKKKIRMNSLNSKELQLTFDVYIWLLRIIFWKQNKLWNVEMWGLCVGETEQRENKKQILKLTWTFMHIILLIPPKIIFTTFLLPMARKKKQDFWSEKLSEQQWLEQTIACLIPRLTNL